MVAFCPRAECQAVLPATEHGLRHLRADPQTSTEVLTVTEGWTPKASLWKHTHSH